MIARETKARELAKVRLNVLESLTGPRNRRELAAEVHRKESAILAETAKLELERAKEKKLQKQIEACKLYATSDGLLVHHHPTTIRMENGASVRERQKLFSIIDLNGPLRVDTKIPESMVDQLYAGQKARIRVEAFPDRVLEGEVKSVQPYPDPAAPGKAGKVYTTLVEIARTDLPLRPGMTARVELLTVDMLSIPTKAVYRIEGKPYVAVKKPDGTFEPRKLNAKYGIPGEWFVVAEKPGSHPGGIHEGDVIAADPTPLLKGEQGDRIRNPPEESRQATPKR